MTTLTVTHTRTHVVVGLADPYLTCDTCGRWVTDWHDPQQCGCTALAFNMPCGHEGGMTGVCPSWGPVDGCRCAEQFGHVPHAEPPATTA